MEASGGSQCSMESAYVDQESQQAFCNWKAPDKGELQGIFEKADVAVETIHQIELFNTKEAG